MIRSAEIKWEWSADACRLQSRSALSANGGNVEGIAGLPWFSEYGFQQTRGFKALKVWMALQFHGLVGYREAIEQNIEFAKQLTAVLKANPRFEVFEPQTLSIVCFRYRPIRAWGLAQSVCEHNKAIVEKLQLGGSSSCPARHQ